MFHASAVIFGQIIYTDTTVGIDRQAKRSFRDSFERIATPKQLEVKAGGKGERFRFPLSVKTKDLVVDLERLTTDVRTVHGA